MSSQRLPPSSVPRYERPRPARYTIADLERETGVSARTIRYYISEGLLQPAYGRGPSATYDADHLLRLRMIQQPLGLAQRLRRVRTLGDVGHRAKRTHYLAFRVAQQASS